MAATKRYDPEQDENYRQALEKANAYARSEPAYTSRYSGQLDDLRQQLADRGAFTYSADNDALYRNYKNEYTRAGQRAMKDTVGQTAALTGGYGSTYSQSAGQQAYNDYMTRLTALLPELRTAAYSEWQGENDRLSSLYSTYSDAESADYDRYLDAYNQWAAELKQLRADADTAYSRGYQQVEDENAAAAELYDRYVSMISTMGYLPSGEELEAAGMSTEEAAAWYAYWLSTQKSSGGSGGAAKKSTTAASIPTVQSIAGQAAKKLSTGAVNAAARVANTGTARDLTAAIRKGLRG